MRTYRQGAWETQSQVLPGTNNGGRLVLAHSRDQGLKAGQIRQKLKRCLVASDGWVNTTLKR